MTDNTLPDAVKVQVVEIRNGREISWNHGVVEKLRDRVDDIRTAIMAGAQAVMVDAEQLGSTTDWHVSQVSATFGITLGAEAGVILSKGSMEATFEVTVTFQRK